jgi:hypothetical protein
MNTNTATNKMPQKSQNIRLFTSLLLLAITTLFNISTQPLPLVSADGCLDFIEISRLPECYHGAFTCLGDVNTNCHIAEHQLHMTLKSGIDETNVNHNQNNNIVKFTFENDGLYTSAIESIYIEDEYNLLRGWTKRQSIQTSDSDTIQYSQLDIESNYFDDAYANFIPFDQHFAVGCQSQQKTNLRRHAIQDEKGCVKNVFTPPPIKNFKEIDEKDREKFEYNDFKNAYTLKKEFREQRQSLTLKFNTKCSVKEIRKAVRVGLIRVGSKLGGFETHPSHKSLLTCPDVIHVGDYQ